MRHNLPKGWSWRALNEVTGPPQYGLSLAASADGNMPMIGMKDIVDSRIAEGKRTVVSANPKEVESCLLNQGDLLLNRTNSPDLVGKLAIWEREEVAVFASYLVRYPARTDVAIPRFTIAALSTGRSSQQIDRLITKAISQANINPTAFYDEVEIAVAPIAEQNRIVAVLDAWDQAIDQTERLIVAKRRQKTGMLVRVFGTERNPLKTKGTPLEDIATIRYGKGLSPADYSSEGHSPVFGTQGEIGRTNRLLFEGPAIVVGRKGTLDKPVLVEGSRPFWAIDTVFVVKPRTNARLLHAFLDFIDLKKLNEASGVPSVSSDNLGALLIPTGATERVEKSEPIILAIQKNIDDAESKLDQLISQKRGLMQKLLTGEWKLGEQFK